MTKRMRKASAGVLMAVAAAITCMAPAAETIAPLQSVSICASAATTSNSSATYTYSIINGRAVVTKVAVKSGVTSIVIPAKLGNKPVVLGANAFKYVHNNLTVDASSVVEVQANAFYQCTGIKQIKFKNCTQLNRYAIYNCSNLTQIAFSGYSGPVSDGAQLVLNSYAVYKCPNLTNVLFGCKDNIIIRKNAFYQCSNFAIINKDKIGLDHASFYVNTGAFNGTNALNKGYLKKASTLASVNTAYNKGDGTKLVGKTAVVTLFINCTGSSWANSYYGYNEKVGRNIWAIEQEAAKYGQTVDIENLSAKVTFSGTVEKLLKDSDIARSPSVLSACKKTFAFASTCTTMDAVTDKIKAEYGAKNVVYVVALNCTGTAQAKATKTANEYAIYYNRSGKQYTWMNQVAQLFGAKKLNTGVKSTAYTKKYYSEDVMYNDAKSSIGWFTAANIGWTDTVLADDYNNIIK